MMLPKLKSLQNQFLFFSVVFISLHNIAAQQRVGIGSVAPAAKLDITGPGAIPAIPGAISNGILRIGVNSIEAIDIGKMVDSTFAGWIQSGYNGFVPDPLSLQPAGGNVGIGTINPSNKLSVSGNANISGNLGIGNTTPGAKLDIIGTIKIADGTQGAGKVLTSDVTGLASWQSPPPQAPQTYYNSVSICCQTWMTKNLDVSTYRNGDQIPNVTNNAEWQALTTGAYCYYNNDSTTYAATYGKLYNWYALNDPRGLAPEGWHTPSNFEWTTLSNCLGGDAVSGGPLKENGTTHWSSPNTGATNDTDFTGLPGGTRSFDGSFSFIGTQGIWWSSTNYHATLASYQTLTYNNDDLIRVDANKRRGTSIRCIKN